MSHRKRERVLWTVTLALGVQIACGGNPTEPSPTSGVTVYQHPNYGGDSFMFVDDFPNFSRLEGPCVTQNPFSPILIPSWNMCVSSVKIAAGWQAIAYGLVNYSGVPLTITADISDLDDIEGPCSDDWDDCIVSIRVSPAE